MSVEVAAGVSDDNDFVKLLNLLVRGLIEKQEPAVFWIIQIDNWFDQKWLRFSGKGVVDFRWPAFMNRYDAALNEFYQDKLTFPPFAPNRVLAQWSYMQVDGRYSETPSHNLPHPLQKKSGGGNLHRRVEDFSQSACFVWYSGKTLSNGKGSVMVYSVGGGRIECWYAAFNRLDRWKLQATKGTKLEDVQKLLSGAPYI